VLARHAFYHVTHAPSPETFLSSVTSIKTEIGELLILYFFNGRLGIYTVM
jgi:hypothetical protein